MDIQQLAKIVKDGEAEISRAEGAVNAIMTELKDKWGINSEAELDAYIARQTTENERLLQEQNTLLAAAEALVKEAGLA